jgi:2-aminoethylphosphonate-pyruvate transaminase
MTDITAIILAAGMGVRMGPRGKLSPKGLIPVGGEAMITGSVASLRAWGAAHIRIVTGHLAVQYDTLFAGTEVELVHNPYYATTGSLRSLMTGLDGIEGPIVILESDLIYAPQALEAIDGTGNRLIVSGPTGAGDEVYVWAHGAQGGPEHLVDISKNRHARPEPHLGELVGITSLTAASVEMMRTVGREVLTHVPEEHYEPGLVELGRAVGIQVVLLDDLAWAEVDDEEMLARAERNVWPRVKAARDGAR